MEQFVIDDQGMVTVHIDTLHELLDDLFVPRNLAEFDEFEDDTTPFSLEERMAHFQTMIQEETHKALRLEKRTIQKGLKYMEWANREQKERIQFYKLQHEVMALEKEYENLQEKIAELTTKQP